MKRELKCVLVALPAAVLLGGAVARPMLAQVEGGLWDISRSANGSNPVRLCVADPAVLAQFEHRGGACTRVVISQDSGEATIHYTCARGGFGQTRMTMITPRALRLDTQGISDGLPFGYVLHARRVGACPGR